MSASTYRFPGWPAKGLALAAAVWILGCGSGIPIRYYTLERGSGAAPERGTGVLTVGVGEVVVDPPYDEDRIAYRPPGTRHEIAFYHYHRWAVPPASALRSGLVAALDRFDDVEARALDGDWSPEVELSVRVSRLEEVDDSEQSIRVVLDLEVRARRAEQTTPSEPLVFTLEAPVGSTTVEAVVEAFATTLDEAASRIVEGLRSPAAIVSCSCRRSPSTPSGRGSSITPTACCGSAAPTRSSTTTTTCTGGWGRTGAC